MMRKVVKRIAVPYIKQFESVLTPKADFLNYLIAE